MDFLTALQTSNATTENGMATNTTSLNANTDLFFTIGAMRGQDQQRLFSMFTKALAEDPLTAMKILFWSRDVREGAGERQIFRDILWYLVEHGHEDVVGANISLIPVFGRWDDISVLFGTKLQEKALELISEGLANGDGLCAKWLPRKGPEANIIRKYLKKTPKEYRKLLVSLTDVVETKMCNGQWNEINFEHVPSVASSKYQKAFGRRATDAYFKYLQAVKAGTAKINASAIYPYDIISSMQNGIAETAELQWKALPNFMEKTAGKIMPLVDSSGSMIQAVGKSSLRVIDVAVSLGLYISERNKGPFQDTFITFSSEPELITVNGTLQDRYTQMRYANWGGSTNIQAAFELILEQAVKFKVSQDEMPEIILILSDMEFDEALDRHNRYHWASEPEVVWNPTVHEMIQAMYAEAGYKTPTIIYWNLQSRHKNVPVKFDETGAALISGFSPSILRSIIGGDEITPISIMNTTILAERYNAVTTE